MMVQSADTSLEAWLEVKKDLTKSQDDIYQMIKEYPNRTAAQYAQILVKPVNSISGRFGELRKLGKIARVERLICPITKSSAWTLRVVQ